MFLELAAVLALSRECAPSVAPETMAAIAHVESGFNPYAIGVNRSARLSRQPTSKAEAVQVARRLLAEGKNIDLGLGQINSSNMNWLGLSVEDAFDPCRNLTASSRVLMTNYRSVVGSAPSAQQALRISFSMYNTGSQTRGFGNGYVRKVENAAAELFGVRGGMSPARPAAIPSPPREQMALAEEAQSRAEAVVGLADAAPAAPPPAWDVFGKAAGGGVHVFGVRGL